MGLDADHYLSQWQGQSTAQIRTVVSALRSASDSVTRNADAQEHASSATGAGSAGAVGTALGAPGESGTVAAALTQPFNGSLLKPFSDIRDFLNSSEIWPIENGTALGLGESKLGAVLPILDALGIAGDTSMSDQDKIIEAGNSATDFVGGLVKDTNLTSYLAGTAIQQWGNVFALAAHADFSPQTVNNVGSYIVSDPAGAFDAAKDAVAGYLPKLVSNLVPKLPIKLPW